MTVRTILRWPDARLRTGCAEVAAVDANIIAMWQDMIDTMNAMSGGVGLAAPQIGVMQRLAVVDASPTRNEPACMANPVVLHASIEPRAHVEASPCLPGVSASITRPRAVTVQFLNAAGLVEEREFVGLWAVSVQHQIDHLDGRMYFDRLSRTRRSMLLKKAGKLARAG